VTPTLSIPVCSSAGLSTSPGPSTHFRYGGSSSPGTTRLETVDFARVEVAEVLRKKGLAAGRLDRMEFLTAVRVIDDLGVVTMGATLTGSGVPLT
jgi:hypothetical protein